MDEGSGDGTVNRDVVVDGSYGRRNNGDRYRNRDLFSHDFGGEENEFKARGVNPSASLASSQTSLYRRHFQLPIRLNLALFMLTMPCHLVVP